MNGTPKLNHSALKCVRILETLFSAGLSGMQFKEICSSTGLPISTTWRLLQTLRHAGWVIEIPAANAHHATWRIAEKPAHLAMSFKRETLSIVQGIEKEYLNITGENLRND